MTKTLVEQYVEDPMHMRLYQQERAICDVTDLIEDVMEEKGIGRAKLAALLGRNKSWVTQLLDGEANKTIRTVADVLAVLGCEFRSFHAPIRISNEVPTVTIEGDSLGWNDAWTPTHLQVLRKAV
ncbi:MAG: helix-turn-helix domain-containing protein [Pirellulaceae bacterium]